MEYDNFCSIMGGQKTDEFKKENGNIEGNNEGFSMLYKLWSVFKKIIIIILTVFKSSKLIMKKLERKKS